MGHFVLDVIGGRGFWGIKQGENRRAWCKAQRLRHRL